MFIYEYKAHRNFNFQIENFLQIIIETGIKNKSNYLVRNLVISIID
jgi:hypothetical protein